jgi:hypothetical protein
MQQAKSIRLLVVNFLIPLVIGLSAGAAILVLSGKSENQNPVARLSQHGTAAPTEANREQPAVAMNQSLSPVESSEPEDIEESESLSVSDQPRIAMAQPAFTETNDVSETAESGRITAPVQTLSMVTLVPGNATSSAGSTVPDAAAASQIVQPANGAVQGQSSGSTRDAVRSPTSPYPYTPEELQYRAQYGWVAFNIAQLNAINPSGARFR